MKKLIPLLLVVLTFAACEKDPDTDKLDNKYLVYTNYDTKADFKAFQDQRKNLRVFFFKHTTSSVYIKRMPYLLPL